MNKKDFQAYVGRQCESFNLLVKSIRKYGIYVYDDPAWQDNYDYGFIVSKKKLSKKEVLEASKITFPEYYKEE